MRYNFLIGFLLMAFAVSSQTTLEVVKNGYVDKTNPCSVCNDEDELFTGLLVTRHGLTRKIYSPFKVKFEADSIVQLLDPYGNATRIATGQLDSANANVEYLTSTLESANRNIVPKVYRAILSQAGSSAPTATVLESTMDTVIVWARSSTGIYTGTLADGFTANKTFGLQIAPKTMFPIYSTLGTITGYYNVTRTSASVITITCSSTAPAAQELSTLAGATTTIPIEILVYP